MHSEGVYKGLSSGLWCSRPAAGLMRLASVLCVNLMLLFFRLLFFFTLSFSLDFVTFFFSPLIYSTSFLPVLGFFFFF